MKALTIRVAICVTTLCGLLSGGMTLAEPKSYDWVSTSGLLFSNDKAAIEDITGQPSFALKTPVGILHFVQGSMTGSFTYDGSAAAFLQSRGSAQAYVGASQDWYAELEVGGVVLGAFSADVGETIVRDGDPTGEPDLFNINACSAPHCTNASGFDVGPWRATFSSIVWNGGSFQDDFLPRAELPTGPEPVPLSIFGFFNEATGQNVSILSRGLAITEAVLEVNIDILPGSQDNCVNINGHGVIPVAVLGDDDLDVADIDQTSLAFGGLSVRIRGNKFPQCSAEYVNDDNHLDLVCKFEDDNSAWEAGDGDATLEGSLLNGKAIRGSDAICMVP